MKLRELLDERRVVVPLRAGTVREATTQLARSLAASGALADEARLTQILEDEWPEDIVSVPGRAFLPHFRTDAVTQVTVALGVSPGPICRGNDLSRCARVVVLIVAPPGEASAYLRTMAAVAEAMSSDEVLDALHAAVTPAAVLAIATLGDTTVPADVMVRDLMSRNVASVTPDMPLRQAAQLMAERGVRAVPVVGTQGEVLGLLSDSHLLTHLLPLTVTDMSTGQFRAVKRRSRAAKAPPDDPGLIPVRDVMDRSVLCLAEDQTVAEVASLMLAKDVDRFPVTREGALVGFLSRGDIIRKLLRP